MTNKLKKTIIDGVEVSPVLPSSIKNYLIDIDGTICDDIPNEQPELMKSAKLYPDALKTLNNSGVPDNNIILLHCILNYPTSYKNANLLMIKPW